MRAKLKVSKVTVMEGSEILHFTAVYKSEGYPEDGSDENNTFAKWTPSADLHMVVTNPELLGRFNIGDEYYVDFSKAQKEA